MGYFRRYKAKGSYQNAKRQIHYKVPGKRRIFIKLSSRPLKIQKRWKDF